MDFTKVKITYTQRLYDEERIVPEPTRYVASIRRDPALYMEKPERGPMKVSRSFNTNTEAELWVLENVVAIGDPVETFDIRIFKDD